MLHQTSQKIHGKETLEAAATWECEHTNICTKTQTNTLRHPHENADTQTYIQRLSEGHKETLIHTHRETH